MARDSDRVLRRLAGPTLRTAVGVCPFCLGTDSTGLTAGLAVGALVLAGTASVAMAAIGRLFWRVWKSETS